MTIFKGLDLSWYHRYSATIYYKNGSMESVESDDLSEIIDYRNKKKKSIKKISCHDVVARVDITL